MLKLGVDIAKSTVSVISKRHGIPPAPQRGWATDGNRVIVHDPATTVAINFAKVLILDQGSICVTTQKSVAPYASQHRAGPKFPHAFATRLASGGIRFVFLSRSPR